MSSAGVEEPKRKRRQNVACDPCKFRRIRCDLTTLLQSLPSGSGEAGDTDAPLRILVRRNPGISCTHCRTKGVKCTTEQIMNPTKPNKGGRRIEEARKRFGGDEEDEATLLPAEEPVRRVSLGDGGVRRASEQSVPGQSWEGTIEEVGSSSRQSRPMFAMTPFEANVQQALDDASFMLGLPAPDPGLAAAYPYPTAPSQVSHLEASWQDFLSIPADGRSSTSTTSNVIVPLERTGRASEDNERLSMSIWQEYGDLDNPHVQQAMYHQHSHRVPRRQTSGTSLEGHLPPSMSPSPNPALERIRDKWVPDNWDVLVSPFADHTAAQQVSHQSWHSPLSREIPVTPTRTATPNTRETHSRASRSPAGPRTRPDLPYMVVARDTFETGSPTLDTMAMGQVTRQRDPDHLWVPQGQQAMIGWGRRNEIEQGMADRSIGMELSRHLINTFFQAAHISLPTISPESFYIDWHRAGQRADLMSPDQEALCAVVEAWGARYSDHPVILGLRPDKQQFAPKVITANGLFIPGTQARAHWGRTRLPACNALLTRARHLIDVNGLLRKPTITGLQALTVYNQLVQMQDQKQDMQAQWMENQMMHTAIIDQMKLLHLMWDSPAPPMITAEVSADTMLSLRIKQRRLFWTAIITDAFWAASSSREPQVSDESVDTAGLWLDAILDKIPSSAFKMLALSMKLYHRLTLVGRSVARDLSVPSLRKGRVDVENFCQIVKGLWHELDTNRDMSTELGNSPNNLPGFSPVNSVSNLRLSIPFLLLIIHQLIRDQLAFRKEMKAAYIVDPSRISAARSDLSGSNTSSPNPETTNIDMLEALSLQSVDILLQSCRAQVDLFAVLLPTGIMQTASIFMRVLIATAQFLSEVPTNEQGYSAETLGGYGWTWAVKQKAVGLCVDGLYQLGWAWSDVGEALDGVMLNMERLTPTPDQIRQWEAAQTQTSPAEQMRDYELGIKVQREKQEGDHLVEVAMRFWPPQSVPEVIEDAMKQLDISRVDAADTIRTVKLWSAPNTQKNSPSTSDSSPEQGTTSHQITEASTAPTSLQSNPAPSTAAATTWSAPAPGSVCAEGRDSGATMLSNLPIAPTPAFDWSSFVAPTGPMLADLPQTPMDHDFDLDALLKAADMPDLFDPQVPSDDHDSALRDFEAFLHNS